MTTLWIFPNLPKYSGLFRTCEYNESTFQKNTLVTKFWFFCRRLNIHRQNDLVGSWTEKKSTKMRLIPSLINCNSKSILSLVPKDTVIFLPKIPTVLIIQYHRQTKELDDWKLCSPLGQRVAVRAQPQTPGFSGPLAHWPDACGFLSPFAFSHSVSASFHSLSFESPPVTEAYKQRGPLGTAT